MANVQGLREMEQKLEAYAAGLKSGAVLAADEIALLLEGYAKSHHPWTARSGNTTDSVKGTVAEASDEIVRVVLSAGMDYDLFLEVCHDGRWAWLWPAIVECKDTIRTILKKRLGAVRV